MERVIFEREARYEVQGYDDMWAWRFLRGFDSGDAAIAHAKDVNDFQRVRVVDKGEQ